jgi:hypothetical protein
MPLPNIPDDDTPFTRSRDPVPPPPAYVPVDPDPRETAMVEDFHARMDDATNFEP